MALFGNGLIGIKAHISGHQQQQQQQSHAYPQQQQSQQATQPHPYSLCSYPQSQQQQQQQQQQQSGLGGLPTPPNSGASVLPLANGLCPLSISAPPPMADGDAVTVGTRDFECIKEVGDGSFGTVWLADWKSALPSGMQVPISEMQKNGDNKPAWAGKRLVAVKRMKKRFTEGWQECLRLKELRSLRAIPPHDNIIPLYDAFLHATSQELYFVFEPMEGNLYQLTKSRKSRFLAGGLIASLFRQILSGLDHIHESGYFHRDLKPENLLLTTTGIREYPNSNPYKSPSLSSPEKDVSVILKLADFGLARETRSRPPYTEYVSTRWYRAPEVLLRSREYSNPVDMWALGTIMAELISLRPMFPGQSELDQISKICGILGDPCKDYSQNSTDIIGGGDWPLGQRLAAHVGFSFPKTKPVLLSTLFPSTVHPSLVDIIAGLLRYEPFARLTAKQCLAHPYSTDVSRVIDPPHAWHVRSIAPKSRHSSRKTATVGSSSTSPIPVSISERSELASKASVTASSDRRNSIASASSYKSAGMPSLPLPDLGEALTFSGMPLFSPVPSNYKMARRNSDQSVRSRASIASLDSLSFALGCSKETQSYVVPSSVRSGIASFMDWGDKTLDSPATFGPIQPSSSARSSVSYAESPDGFSDKRPKFLSMVGKQDLSPSQDQFSPAMPESATTPFFNLSLKRSSPDVSSSNPVQTNIKSQRKAAEKQAVEDEKSRRAAKQLAAQQRARAVLERRDALVRDTGFSAPEWRGDSNESAKVVLMGMPPKGKFRSEMQTDGSYSREIDSFNKTAASIRSAKRQSLPGSPVLSPSQLASPFEGNFSFHNRTLREKASMSQLSPATEFGLISSLQGAGFGGSPLSPVSGEFNPSVEMSGMFKQRSGIKLPQINTHRFAPHTMMDPNGNITPINPMFYPGSPSLPDTPASTGSSPFVLPGFATIAAFADHDQQPPRYHHSQA